MGSKRIKRYLMRPIPEGMGGAGRFNAYFVGDNYSVDAFTEILPDVIAEEGLKVSSGVAKQLITSFMTKCVKHTAETGETVTVPNIGTSMLGIKGSYERRKSSASKENVRVTFRLQEDMRPTVSFTMVNALTGKIVTLQSVTSPGCEPGFVKQNSEATLNGLNLEMLEGDSVTAAMKNAEKEEVVIPCQYESEGSTRLNVVIPAAFNDPFYVGKEIVFKVINRCGDPDSEQDSDTIKATLLAGDTPPAPTPAPVIEEGISAASSEEGDHKVYGGDADYSLWGSNLTGATVTLLWEGYEGDVPANKAEIESDGSKIRLDGEYLTATMADAEHTLAPGGAITFKVTTAGGTAEYETERADS